MLRETSDGRVVIRPPRPGDAAVLIAGRDEVFHRFLGPGADEPRPTGCILVEDEIVGWIDYDVGRAWNGPGEVNVGYNVFAPHRGMGYATRALQLLMHHLAVDSPHHTATLSIDPANERSLALARRAGFVSAGTVEGEAYFKRAVPPLAYTDGVVTIRRQSPSDHAFATGPKWTFAVDAAGATCVGYVDGDLANEHVPAGEANVSYSSHPAHRGKGYASRAVRLVLQFLRDHTGAREAHLIVDAENGPSPTATGRTTTRHVVRLR